VINPLFLAILIISALLVLCIRFLFKYRKRLVLLKTKYGSIIDLDAHREALKKELASNESELAKLRQEYLDKHQIYDSLIKELALYEEELEITSYGLYKPHYDFQAAESYKLKLEQIRERQKSLIREDRAFFCRAQWRVNNSIIEGRRQTKQYGKLMLRAFNGECDALVSNVRWNNIVKMEERINNSFEAINKLGTVHQIEIAAPYRDLKLEELRLAYEYEEKRHQEKEEQRRIQEQIREEERVQREIEEAKKEAEEEEKRYSKALEQARKELGEAQGAEAEILKNTIASLETQLRKALEKKERAMSQAQFTKSGHIYIISNIGSFGEDVFKIGMTRRLDPDDRVDELSGASVPFKYDKHAMIPTDNAPELEYNIHKRIEDKRINLLNNRKEFFKVSLDEIEKIVREFKADIELIKTTEAREYRESLAMRAAASRDREGQPPKVLSKFPETI
jgi:DNA repair exonuclease SbcCD ATPase subunit